MGLYMQAMVPVALELLFSQGVYPQSILTAKTGVLGGPLNRLAPANPDRISSSPPGNSAQSITNSAWSDSLGNGRDQNGADSHWGTIRVPKAFVFWACLITLGTRHTGGNHQLFSSFQLQVNVSTASEPGVQNLELKHTSWELWALANLSMV